MNTQRHVDHSPIIIDSHVHIFPPEIIAHRGRYCDDGAFRVLYSSPGARMCDHEILLKTMDEAGIAHAVALGFPWRRTELCRLHNRYMREAARESGGRIIPFGSVPVCDEHAIADAVREIVDLDLAGIGEVAWYDSGIDRHSVTVLHAIFSAAGDVSLPVCLHVNEQVGHRYPGKQSADFMLLYELVKRHPDVVIILAHWGGGILFYELMKEVREAFKNVYYDTAATPYLYDDAIYSIATDIVGAEKILFGSDYPLINPLRYIDTIRGINIHTNTKEAILGVNARKAIKLQK